MFTFHQSYFLEDNLYLKHMYRYFFRSNFFDSNQRKPNLAWIAARELCAMRTAGSPPLLHGELTDLACGCQQLTYITGRDAVLRGREKPRRLLLKPVVISVPLLRILSCEYRAYGRGKHVQSQQRRPQEGHQNEDTGLSCKCTQQNALCLVDRSWLGRRGRSGWLNANRLASWGTDMTCLFVAKVRHQMFIRP